LFEFLEQCLQLFAGQVKAEGFDAVVQRGAPAVLA